MIEAAPEIYGALREQIKTPELTGHVIWQLWKDPQLAEMNGRTLIGAKLAACYGIKDEGDRQPPSYRTTHRVAPQTYYPVVIR